MKDPFVTFVPTINGGGMEIAMDCEKVVQTLSNVVNKLKQENQVDNVIIKNDIFKILEKHCIVLYYPVADEDNRGFHTKRAVNNEMKDFVYINTAKPLAEQVFTAAHELGHVWDVKGKVLEELPECEDYVTKKEEKIINRFAAELLMPKKVFRKTFYEHLKDADFVHKPITLKDFVRIIVMQMNDFMVPYEAVKRRLLETEMITEEVALSLDKHNSEIELLVMSFSKEQNTLLDQATRKKTIPGLRKLWEKVEAEKCLDEYRISKIKKDFDLDTVSSPDEVVTITG